MSAFHDAIEMARAEFAVIEAHVEAETTPLVHAALDLLTSVADQVEAKLAPPVPVTQAPADDPTEPTPEKPVAAEAPHSVRVAAAYTVAPWNSCAGAAARTPAAPEALLPLSRSSDTGASSPHSAVALWVR